MNNRFSFGNMDEDEPETALKVEEVRAVHREAVIRPLPKKNTFWDRWFGFIIRKFRKHEPVHYETSL